jgi:beta-lactamase regulating signal transducer with metallopeptidase domain
MTAAVASWLFAATWKGSLLVAFALVVHRVARNRIPSRWLFALLFVAVLRLLAPVLPATPFSIFNLVQAPAPPAPHQIEVQELRPRVPRGATVARVPAPPPSTGPWIPLLLGGWAFGAAFVAMRAVVQTLRFRQRLRDARPVDLSSLIEECVAVINRGSPWPRPSARRIRVLVTRAVAAPSLHGFLRPSLLLPEGFLDTFTREQLRYALLHELAHLRRSDVLVNWIATAASAVHWFNPLVHLALSRLAEERELACDALALEALRAEERQAYGGTVLEIVDRLRRTQLVPALVGMTATPRQLKRRILMIASFQQPRYTALFAVLVLTIGMVTLTDAQAHEPQVMRFHKTLSGEASAMMKTLEKPIAIDLRMAGVADVLSSISASTGASIRLAEGVEAPSLRLNIKGENVPAHIVLHESMSSAGLGVKFTETGVEIVKETELELLGGPGERVIIRKHEGGDASEHADGKRVMILRKHPDADHPMPALREGEEGTRRRIEVTAEATDDGVSSKRKVTLKGENGETTGSLEIEALK